MSTNFWDLVQKANHPNYCDCCVRIGGYCGGMGCGGQFWQQDWDKVLVCTRQDGSQFIDDSQNQIQLNIPA